MIEPLVNDFGDVLAELDWQDGLAGGRWCDITNGTSSSTPTGP